MADLTAAVIYSTTFLRILSQPVSARDHSVGAGKVQVKKKKERKVFRKVW